MENTEQFSKKMAVARKEYGLSCAFMGEILGLGANQWRNYEKKEMTPNRSKHNLIRLAITPISFMRILDASPKMIKDRKEFPNLYFKVQSMCFEIERDLQRIKDDMNNNYFKI